MGEIYDQARQYLVGPSASAGWEPDKADGLTVFKTIDRMLSSNLSVGLIYSTRAALYADLAHAAPSSALVIGDPVPAYNGVYAKAGASGAGSWSRAIDLPFSVIPLYLSGGTATALEASSVLPLPVADRAAMITFVAVAASASGGTTIAINGASPLPIVDATGAPITAASWGAGAVVTLWQVGGSLRMTVQADFAGLASAAITASAAAVAAAAAVEMTAVSFDGPVDHVDLPWTPASADSLTVMVGGIDQTSRYTVSGSRITLSEMSPAGPGVVVVRGRSWTGTGVAPASDEIEFQGGAVISGGEYNYDFAITDEAGAVVFGIMGNEVYMPATRDDARDLAVIDTLARETARSVISRTVTGLQALSSTYNVALARGQSLGVGYETWPALSSTPVDTNLMVGDAVRQRAASTPAVPLGVTALNPLRAVNINSSGTALLTDVETAALAPGDGAVGEPPIIAALNTLRLFTNEQIAVETASKRLVGVNVCVSGKTIEQLSKINTQDTYDRWSLGEDMLDILSGLVPPSDVRVAATLFIQGENNYRTGLGGSCDYASYRALLDTFIDDCADEAAARGGKPPGFFLYQTTGAYTRDVDGAGNPGLHVGMAQINVSNARGDTFMVGPSYPYTDKEYHLDANGSRWMGVQFGKVMHRVLVQRRNWAPLQPVKITQPTTSTIRIVFHVPEPPLQWRPIYVGSTATTYPTRGFRVSDDLGDVVVTSVDIVAGTVVDIILARPTVGIATVWYASYTTFTGNGNLFDSDSTLSPYDYEYLPGSGMYSAANIPELVGKPYPLNNACIAFAAPVGYEVSL